MNQNSSNLSTPQISDELHRQLEPGYCCVCKKYIKIPKFEKNKVILNYFYLTPNAKTDNCKYIVFICESCKKEQIKQRDKQLTQYEIFNTHLKEKKFWINILGEEKQADPETLSFSFKKSESQAASGYLSNQNHLCENCNKLEQQFKKYEESFINYASATSQRALLIAKELADEQLKEDQYLYEQYKIRYDNSQDNQEKFYLKMKLEKIQDKYKNSHNEHTIYPQKISKN